jgi:transcriptional/translational regulatory protein YebC/TACO1
MIDRLEELDDVQNVTSNYELSDAVAEELENEE